MFGLLPYLPSPNKSSFVPSPFKSSFVKDFSYSVKMHELILMSYNLSLKFCVTCCEVCSIPRLSDTLNKLLGVGIIKFGSEFCKTSYYTDLRISRRKLSYFLIVYGIFEFTKYAVLQDICTNLSLFLVG